MFDVFIKNVKYVYINIFIIDKGILNMITFYVT